MYRENDLFFNRRNFAATSSWAIGFSINRDNKIQDVLPQKKFIHLVSSATQPGSIVSGIQRATKAWVVAEYTGLNVNTSTQIQFDERDYVDGFMYLFKKS